MEVGREREREREREDLSVHSIKVLSEFKLSNQEASCFEAFKYRTPRTNGETKSIKSFQMEEDPQPIMDTMVW